MRGPAAVAGRPQKSRKWHSLTGSVAPQRRSEARCVVSADAANLAVLEMQFDRVETRHVVEPEAWPHPDAEAVQHTVANDADIGDVGARHPVPPGARAEKP